MYKLLQKIKSEFNSLMGEISVHELVTNCDLIDSLKRFEQIISKEIA